MWKTMIFPLFNGILALIGKEKSKKNCADACRLIQQTFKNYMMIPKTTDNKLVWEMIGIDFVQLVLQNLVNSKLKWEARRDKDELDLVQTPERKNYLRGIPNDFCQILKQQCSLCELCRKSIRNEQHMDIIHKIDIFSYKDLWEAIKEYHENSLKIKKKQNEKERKPALKIRVKRKIYLDYWKPWLIRVKEDTIKKFESVYIRTSQTKNETKGEEINYKT